MPKRRSGHYAALNTALALLMVCLALAGCGEGSGQGDPEGTPERAPAASVASKDVEAALAAAESYLASGEPVQAEAIIALLVEKAPDNALAREMYGRIRLAQAAGASASGDPAMARQRFAEAYEQYRQACKLDPQSAGLQQSAGEIAHTAGLLPEALVHYQAAGQLDRLDLRPPLYEAQVLIEMGRLDEAENALQTAMAIDADEPTIHASLAAIELARADYEAALRHIHVARRISPDDLRFRVQEARIHRRAGYPTNALELLVNLRPEERAEAGATFEIASGFEMIGDHVRAAEAWEHRCRLAPSAPDAGSNAARAGLARLRAGQREQAWSWLKQARLLDPDAAEVRQLEQAMAN